MESSLSSRGIKGGTRGTQLHSLFNLETGSFAKSTKNPASHILGVQHSFKFLPPLLKARRRSTMSFGFRHFEDRHGKAVMTFEEDLDFFLMDEVDGADEMFHKKRYYLNCHRSIVFNPEIYIPDILSDYKDLMDQMTSLTEDRGVFKKIIRQGDGNYPALDTEIFLHYNGFLEYGDEPFDASTMRKTHQIFKLENNSFFPGMQLAVESMQYNEVAQFIFTPTYFFGELGCPPKIPTGMSSMFFIELLDIKNVEGAKRAYDRSFEELQELSFNEIIADVEKLKEAGNAKYSAHLYDDAIIRYLMGLEVLDNYIYGSFEEDRLRNMLKLKLLANLAQCYILINNDKKALQVCRMAFIPDMPKPQNAKLHFRYGKLLIRRGKLDKSAKIIREGLTIEPKNRALVSLYKEVKGKLRIQKREMLKNDKAMIKGLLRRNDVDVN